MVRKGLNGKKGVIEKAKIEGNKGVIHPTPESAFWSWMYNPLVSFYFSFFSSF
jgi:hypothetical protein